MPYGERVREQSGKNTNERLEKDIVTKRQSLYGTKREIERGNEACERHKERNREKGRIRPPEPQAHRKKNLWPINTGKLSFPIR